MHGRKIEIVGLICGVAVPVVYFGIQLVAAPFYPEYSFSSNDASTLGSPGSSFPALFNFGTLVVGALLLFASYGLVRAFVRIPISPWLRWPMAIALIASAISSFNAGVFPMPDERHSNGLLASLGVAMFLFPVLLPFAFRSADIHKSLHVYLWANLVMLLSLVPVISGLLQRLFVTCGVEFPVYQEFLNNGHGVLQRIAALAVFAPIGILSVYFLKTRDQKTNAG